MQLHKRLGMRKQGSLGTILEALCHIGVYSRETKIDIHKKHYARMFINWKQLRCSSARVSINKLVYSHSRYNSAIKGTNY